MKYFKYQKSEENNETNIQVAGPLFFYINFQKQVSQIFWKILGGYLFLFLD